MDEREWLTSTDSQRMLGWLDQGWQTHRSVSDRKLRLFACACHRYASTPPSEEALAAIEASELWADGGPAADHRGWTVTCEHPLEAAEILAQCTGERQVFAPARAALLRCIFGNPFHETGLKWINGRLCRLLEVQETPEKPRRRHRGPYVSTTLVREKWQAVDWLAWQDGTVPRLARAIYDERAFDRLGILADALEEAGCTDEDILAHCRGLERCPCLGKRCCEYTDSPDPDLRKLHTCALCDSIGWRPTGPHARGCHVLDLILGLE